MNELAAKYEIFRTGDGSPTLTFRREDGYREKMHHSAGALSESLYIYHSALEWAAEKNWPLRVVSIGLGLGYNELLAVTEALRQPSRDFQIWSFESDEDLRNCFASWLSGSSSPLNDVYEEILSGIERKLEVETRKIREATALALADGRLQLLSAFPEAARSVHDARVIFYDAFSSKMSPELWREDTLVEVLEPLLAKECLLTTYAATGALNRALKRLGFGLKSRSGFYGKRESTLAIRGLVDTI